MLATKITNYALCMTLIFLSGSPALSKNNYELYISVFFVLLLLLALKVGISISRRVMLVTFIFVVLIAFHILLLGQSVALASIGFLLQMGTAALIVAVIPQFMRYFVHCMFFIALISLFFYFLFQLPGQQGIFAPFDLADERNKINIGLYTFFTFGKSAARNSGIFWEPGAFAGYLALALYCVAVYGRKLKVSVLEVLVMIVALGATLSTMGYAAFMVVCGAYCVRKFSGRNPLLVFVGLPIAAVLMMVLAWQLANSIPFLKEKIVEQAQAAEDGDERSEKNRFGNAIYDLEFVAKRPIAGWSADTKTRLAEDSLALDLLSGQGNALSGFAVRFGIVGWLTMMGAFFTTFLVTTRSVPLAVLGIFLISVMFTGEKYMNFPLIMTFLFMSYKHVNALARSHRRRRPNQQAFESARSSANSGFRLRSNSAQGRSNGSSSPSGPKLPSALRISQ